MRRRVLFLMVAAVALAQSCGEEFLDGDWYLCKDDGCTQLDDEGARFDPDGRFAILNAPGSSYEPGEVPEVSAAVGRYAVSGNRVTLQASIEGQTATAHGTLEGEYLILTIKTQVEVCSGGAPTSGTIPASEPAASGGCTTRDETETMRLKRVGDGGPIPSTGPVAGDGPDVLEPRPDVPEPRECGAAGSSACPPTAQCPGCDVLCIWNQYVKDGMTVPQIPRGCPMPKCSCDTMAVRRCPACADLCIWNHHGLPLPDVPASCPTLTCSCD